MRPLSALIASRPARLAWAVPGLATAAFAGVLAWAAIESLPQQAQILRGSQWWQRALAPNAQWTLPALLGLWAISLAVYWWPRRGEGSNVSLLTLLTMTVVGAGLGAVCFYPCATGQAPVVAPLSWVMMLFTGSLEPRFGAGTSCPGQFPLALQLARLLCLGATFIGVVAAATVLWRGEIERLKTHFVSELTVLTGLDSMTLGLLRELVAKAAGRKIVVIESDPNHPMLEEARATGARVIIGDPAHPDDLRHVLTHRGRSSARTLFALHPGAADNEEILKAAKVILSGAVRHADRDPHLVARIDDPRHADTWRGDHIAAHEPWLDDALSPYETTAVNAVRQALGHQPRTLIVCGDTTLALAILIEAAWSAWERSEIRKAEQSGGLGMPSPEPHFAVIQLLDEHASELKREFGATGPPALRAALGEIRLQSRPWDSELLDYLDSLAPQVAEKSVIIITDEPTPAGAHEAGRVARLHPKTPIYFRSSDRVGVPESVFDQLYYYQPGFLVHGNLPPDTWTRLARHNHETYRLRWPATAGSPNQAARQPWDVLDDFFKEENIRQIRQVLSSALSLRRRWRPLRVVAPGSIVELTESELARLAEAEHERWYARRLAANWRPPRDGEAPDNSQRVNPSVVPWEELPGQVKDGNVAHVQSILSSLEAIGYVPALPDTGPPEAAAFQRHGEVRAIRLRAPRIWRAAGGTAMRAKLGDWSIRDEHGDERTVQDSQFRASHSYISNDRWARTGRVRAWQVSEVTVVRTLEGPARAAAGDWVVQGTHGERWPVPDARFRRHYQPVPGGSRESVRSREGTR